MAEWRWRPEIPETLTFKEAAEELDKQSEMDLQAEPLKLEASTDRGYRRTADVHR